MLANSQRLENLRIVSYEEEVALMSHYVNAMGRPLEILEAGCGRKWSLKLSVPYRLTGIDADEDALTSRQQTKGDLSTSIIGDLCAVSIPPSTFDVIYCSYVLEHINEAHRALANFACWLKPGGLILIRVPDRDAIYGWLTRHSPFWLHVLYKRWIEGQVNAGKPGFAPYPVYYNKAISRAAMIDYCKEHRYELCELVATDTYLANSLLVRIIAQTCSALSLGRYPWRHNNLAFIIRAPA